MSLLVRVKDVWRLSIQENALIMVQEASPDDDDWWEVFYMYMKCITRHKTPHHLQEPYIQVLEKIRSANDTNHRNDSVLYRFYASATLGLLAEQRQEYTTAIRLYDEAEWLYETISPQDRQRQVLAIPEQDTAFVSLLTSTDTESVGAILDREIQNVRLQWSECQEQLRQSQQDALQAEVEHQKYKDLAQKMSEDSDAPPPNDLLHLWQFPNEATATAAPTNQTSIPPSVSPNIIVSSHIMEQVRKLPMHPKVAWLLQRVEDHGQPDLHCGQVYRVSRKNKHQPKLVHVVAGDSSCNRVQQLLHTYATVCETGQYRPARVYLEAQDAQDPQLLCLLALMGCVHISEHRLYYKKEQKSVHSLQSAGRGQ